MMTTAKGMGNGFPIGGVLIAPHIQASYGLLGTTFGGNHLACTAANVVLDIIEEEKLLDNATKIGAYIENELVGIPGITDVRGRGLMIGIELEAAVGPVRDALLHEHHIFMGYAGKHFLESLKSVLKG
jgi:acetylornithine aminotransferase